MSRYVLIFSLGPVQPFIAEARRAGDLWAGSRILSELARAAADNIGGTLVSPASASKQDVSNKIVAIVDDPASAADKAESAVRKEWQWFANEALKHSRLPTGDGFQSIWDRQLISHLEFYWAAAEIEYENYQAAYGAAALTLDARKYTRTFVQNTEEGPKDSISGQRAALPVVWESVSEQDRAQVKSGERLDTMGVIKRWAFDDKFPSVSTVASARFVANLTQVQKSALTQAIEAVNRRYNADRLYRVGHWARDFDYDGDLLYEETYARERLKSSYGIETANEARQALLEIYDRKRTGKQPVRPSPYYAVLQMDGDYMGKHIGACRDEQEHRNLSERLASFASRVRKELVKAPDGYLIYAGGDDVLALLPLDRCFSVVAQLEQAYRETFADWSQVDETGKPMSFTISAGLAVAHHLYPLDAALAEARRAEKSAKTAYQRDALCISVLKRSGETVRMGTKWLSADVEGGALGMIGQTVDHFHEDRLSSKLAYEFLSLAEAMAAIPGAVQLMLKRLLQRHGNDNLTDAMRQQMLSEAATWTAIHDNVLPKQTIKRSDGKDEEVPQGLVELGRWLVLARFMAQGGEE